MTNPPSDLASFRTAEVIPLTGLSGNDVGIAPDPAHLSSGGYHVGCEDIQAIGRWDRDYSTRQARDRLDGTNASSAMDIGDDWPRGGRPAWLRFNNLLVKQMRAGDPALAALRAVNFSPDGTARKRYDSNNPGQGVIDSTDSVYMHTHLEWWRNTAGLAARARSLLRITLIIDAAIRNVPLEDDDMTNLGFTDKDGEYLCARLEALAHLKPVQMGPEKGQALELVELLKRLDAAAAADTVRDDALAAAVKGLAVGAGVDPDALMERINAAVTGAVKPMQDQLAAVQARNLALARALAAAGGALDAADD